MIYTPLTRKAMSIAYDAHHGQVDQSGVPYILHPVHLAEQMDDEISCCVALLHDVAEDTAVATKKDFYHLLKPLITYYLLEIRTFRKGLDFINWCKFT